MSSPTLLSVEDVVVAYGNVVAVRKASLQVTEGTMTTLLGPNGAGKSTLIGAVCGLERPRSGVVLLDGVDVTGRSAHRMARSGVRLVPETRAIFPEMTVRENLLVGAGRLGRDLVSPRLEGMGEIFPVLAVRQGQRAGTLSGGEQQMLAIARALIAEPRLLVLDEPSMGLAPLIIGQIVEALVALRDSGTTILVAEQNARPVLPVCDQAVLLVRGRVVRTGTGAELTTILEGGYFGVGTGP